MLVLRRAKSNLIWQQRKKEHGKSRGETKLGNAMAWIKGLLGDSEAVESMTSLFKKTELNNRRKTPSSSSSGATGSSDSISESHAELEKSPQPPDEEVQVAPDLEIDKILGNDEAYVPEQQDTPKNNKGKVSKRKD